jgi:hypothetical protein
MPLRQRPTTLFDELDERLALLGSGMILGSGPLSRPSGPAESGPDCPLPGGGRGAAKSAQFVQIQ